MISLNPLGQQLQWEGKNYHGYVAMGNGLDDDSLPITKEALIFVVVSVNGIWKLPVRYFLIAELSAAEKVNLVKLHSAFVTVISSTCDGATSNIGMINNLGCSFEYDTVESVFMHSAIDKPVCVFELEFLRSNKKNRLSC